MADYRQITVDETLPDAPVTSDLMTALAENPTAIAEGASGAPKVIGHALNTYLGNTVTTTGLDEYSHVLVNVVLTSNASDTAVLTYRRSSNGGATWSGTTPFLNQAGTLVINSTVVIDVTSFNAINIQITGGTISSINVLGLSGVSP